MNLFFGYSPCPNDTYMFALISKKILKFSTNNITSIICDVETLNRMVINEVLDISKVSFYTYLRVKSMYSLINTGCAIGFNCGPVLVSKKKLNKDKIINSRIVFPGKFTTAHLLFKLWAPSAKNFLFTTYEKIFDYLKEDKADCGVIIHESRFAFIELGFKLLVDLGSWWENKTKMPVPLGCIVVKKQIGIKKILDVENVIISSIKIIKKYPEEVFPYIKIFSQEFISSIIVKHILTFVNKFSINFDKSAFKSINRLHLEVYKVGIL